MNGSTGFLSLLFVIALFTVSGFRAANAPMAFLKSTKVTSGAAASGRALGVGNWNRAGYLQAVIFAARSIALFDPGLYIGDENFWVKS